MLKSMTGFGQANSNINGKKVSVEVRALNSRTLDANLRLPSKFRELEPDIRTLINGKIDRGKIDFYLIVENETDLSEYKINRALAKHYLNELQLLGAEAGLPLTSDLLPFILRLPDVVTQSAGDISDQDKQAVICLTEEALEKADVFRIQEGILIEEDFKQRIQAIIALLEQVEPFEKIRIQDIRKRLHSDLAQLEQGVKIDSNRFEQELIYYLERIDFTEEKFRLEKHCLDFLQTMAGKDSQGRKLGFIAQEIGREINTLGSKAYNSDIQKIVIEMKNELEKIKEQLLNIL